MSLGCWHTFCGCRKQTCRTCSASHDHTKNVLGGFEETLRLAFR